MKKKLIIFISTLIGILILNYVIGVIIYSSVFSGRIESETYLMSSMEDFPDLESKRHEFTTSKKEN